MLELYLCYIFMLCVQTVHKYCLTIILCIIIYVENTKINICIINL